MLSSLRYVIWWSSGAGKIRRAKGLSIVKMYLGKWRKRGRKGKGRKEEGGREGGERGGEGGGEGGEREGGREEEREDREGERGIGRDVGRGHSYSCLYLRTILSPHLGLAASLPPFNRVPNCPMGCKRLTLLLPTKFCARLMMVDIRLCWIVHVCIEYTCI